MTRILYTLAFVAILAAPARAAGKVDFQRDIRPILSDFCFKCHGPDEKSRKARLRLDVRQDAVKKAIVAGKPEDSDLIKRIVTTDETEVMPPPSTKKKLSAEQVRLLRQWIAEGATYQTHWAYVAPQRPALPNVKQPELANNAIDLFILARLQRDGLSLSPRASRETLLRRLSLDLVGLPPAIDSIDTFLADPSPEAYRRQLERLLASPHYGERWGRHWLDAARYADSDGYEKDKPRSVWMFRDWVVQALNRDLPYDQFILEQIAGDLLPNATQDQHVATGFLRNSMINEEGGIDPEQFRMEAMFDRMDALSRAVLGLTLNCAQCHTHKYDPFTQEDYYRLFAYLNDTHESSLVAYTPMEVKKRTDLLLQIRDLETQLRMKNPGWEKQQAKWEEQVKKDDIPWQVVKAQNAGDNSQRYVYNEDGSLTAGGYAPTKWTSVFRGQTDCKKITGIRLEMLTDPELPLNGPGRSPSGLFALSEFVVEVADVKKPNESKKVKFVSATADFGNERMPLDRRYDDRSNKARFTGPITYAIDGDNLTAWGIDAGAGRRNVDRKAVFIPEKPIEASEGAILTFRLVQMHGGWNSDDNQNNNLGRFRFSVTSADKPGADPRPRRVHSILNLPVEARTPAQQQAVFSYWRTTMPEWKDINDKIEALWKQHPEGTPQLTLMKRDKGRQTFVLERGDFLKPTKPITAGTPPALHPMKKDAGVGRLALAKWLVDRNSPTTARAMVNRVWQAYFGTGLVSTSEDLGVQSETPSHPELLDWLAVEFMESGWSLKHLHTLITTSATYQQSSRVTPELLRVDPDNRLLARSPRFRVEGEVVRDVTLSAAGLLEDRIGGSPSYPPAPSFLFVPPASYGPKVWGDGGKHRRGMYIFRFRSVPYPMLTTFDAPNGDASCVRRTRSNTPLQALATLNEPVALEAARALGRRAMLSDGDEDARLSLAFRLSTGRKPTIRELGVLKTFLSRQVQRFSETGANPWGLAADDSTNPPPLPSDKTAAQAAAWTAVARLLLNLDETITRE